jgi:hypothetical protein
LKNNTVHGINKPWSGGVGSDEKKSNTPALQCSITPAYIKQWHSFHSLCQLVPIYFGHQGFLGLKQNPIDGIKIS